MIATTILTFVLIGQTSALSAKAAQVSAPVQVDSIDAGKLKGEPTQLAWSPDGSKLFLQMSERDKAGMTINPHFFIMSASAGKPEKVDPAPAWAAEYWAWKSGQAAPGAPAVKIDFTEDYQTVTSTSSPMGGALAKGSADASGSGGTTAEDVANHAQQMQKQHVVVFKLKGETIGQFVGQQVLPGYTFGWSPAAVGLMAYGSPSGHLALIDRDGRKQEVDATKNVILPAWSNDGSKIAFLQKSGKNKYDLFVVTVTR